MAATATPLPNEKLPRGVGRVPTWWMELTPHYTLDLEEDQNRREQEEQEALYYASMAALDDTRTAGEWKSNWGGRSTKDGGNSGGPDGGLFGGRNFQPGTEGWDPKQWGIKADDPDYQSYLKGAKLPQSYIDAMKSFAGQAGLKYDATNLNHSKYGRQAEKPAFTPAWAKKKLKKTGQGQSIRQGVYQDSPNKHLHRVNDHLHRVKEKKAHPGEDISPSSAPPETTPVPASPPAPAPTSTPVPVPAPAPAVVHTTTLPMPSRSNTPAAASPAAEAPEEKQKKYNFSDYYYNAGTTPAIKSPDPTPPEQAPPKPAAPAPTPVATSPPAPVTPPTQPEEEEEYEEVVEYVEEYEDGEEGEEYEEVVEYEEEYEEEAQAEQEAAPVVPQSANLSDLQLLLAQKQAELAKLQGV